MKNKVIIVSVICFLSLCSVQTSAQLLTTRQDNMVKALIDVEYEVLKSNNKNAKLPFDHSLISRNRPLTDQTKSQTYKKVRRYIQLNAQRSEDLKYGYYAKEIDNQTDMAWIIFCIVLVSYNSPEFICQENNDLCRRFVSNIEKSPDLLASLDPNQMESAVQYFCNIEKDCSKNNRDQISRKLKKEFSRSKDEKYMNEQLIKLNLEYN